MDGAKSFCGRRGRGDRSENLQIYLSSFISAPFLFFLSFFADYIGDSTNLSEFPPVEERSGPEGAEEDCPDSSQRQGHLVLRTAHF